MTRADIFKMIDDERKYQESKWGQEFDLANTANDWVTYIVRYAAAAAEPMVHDKKVFETKMVKVAALAVAALEAVKQGGPAPRHYD